jgi:aminopeptidase
LNPIEDYKVNKIDYMLTIWGTNNIKHLSGIDPSKQQKYFRTIKPMREKMFARMDDKSLIWCGTVYPTPAFAQNAGMSTSDYEDFVYHAGHLHEDDPTVHWKNVEKEQDRLIEILNQSRTIKIHAEGTDLEMCVEGRKWINCCGRVNFPDGELFASPIEDSASGTISFTYPANYKGRDVEGVKLTFEEGKVVKATANSDEEFLLSMLDTDEGARRVGEMAIGTNYEITKFTRNTLFDEKIGGTCHLAVGSGMGESGGVNKSTIHWDMVCDLKAGEIEADGKVIYKNGQFVI